MKNILFLSLLLSFLTGCISVGVYRTKVSSWIGHDAEEMIRAWGYPSQSFQSPQGNEVYLYQSVNYGQTGSYLTSPQFTSGQFAFGGQVTEWYCRTWFEAHEGKIISWRFEGNNCK